MLVESENTYAHELMSRLKVGDIMAIQGTSRTYKSTLLRAAAIDTVFNAPRPDGLSDNIMYVCNEESPATVMSHAASAYFNCSIADIDSTKILQITDDVKKTGCGFTFFSRSVTGDYAAPLIEYLDNILPVTTQSSTNINYIFYDDMALAYDLKDIDGNELRDFLKKNNAILIFTANAAKTKTKVDAIPGIVDVIKDADLSVTMSRSDSIDKSSLFVHSIHKAVGDCNAMESVFASETQDDIKQLFSFSKKQGEES